MKTKKNNSLTLEQFKDKHYGKRGTTKREKLESGYENFKIGALLHEARLEKGLTQEELAEKVGTTKSYISKNRKRCKRGQNLDITENSGIRFRRTDEIINKIIRNKTAANMGLLLCLADTCAIIIRSLFNISYRPDRLLRKISLHLIKISSKGVLWLGRHYSNAGTASKPLTLGTIRGDTLQITDRTITR